MQNRLAWQIHRYVFFRDNHNEQISDRIDWFAVKPVGSQLRRDRTVGFRILISDRIEFPGLHEIDANLLLPAQTGTMSLRPALSIASLIPTWVPESSGLTISLRLGSNRVSQPGTTSFVFSDCRLVVRMSNHFIFGAIFFRSVMTEFRCVEILPAQHFHQGGTEPQHRLVLGLIHWNIAHPERSGSGSRGRNNSRGVADCRTAVIL